MGWEERARREGESEDAREQTGTQDWIPSGE